MRPVMATLTELAATLTGPLVVEPGTDETEAISRHVSRFFAVLKELEEQTRQRNRPSMRDTDRLPRSP
jgi:hypothetical protein